MEDINKFLEDFMEAEIQVLKRFLEPDLDNYNKAVDAISEYTVKELENGFGAKIRRLKRPSYYERVKNYVPPTKRFIFRIDKHEVHGEEVYRCFLSNVNPNNYKCYFSNFIVGRKESELKILASYIYSDKGMGGQKKYYFHDGIEKYNKRFGDFWILDTQKLGRAVEINRILEPSDDEYSMKEFLNN